MMQEEKPITVDEAISRGRSMLLLPRILMITGLFFFMFPVALIIMAIKDGPPLTQSVWLIFGGVILLCFVVFFFLPFLYWSKTTTRWKLWAFTNVNDVHELKNLALELNLYPAYGSVMDKLQIQSKAERERWQKLQEQFKQLSVSVDDPSIPAKTVIRFSTAQMVANLVIGLFFMGVGGMLLYFVSQREHKIWPQLISIMIALSPSVMIVKSLKKLIRKEPQLVLDYNGFYSKSTGLVAWNLVYNQHIETIYRARRGTKYILNLQHPGGLAKIDITNLNIRKAQLERLMRYYKGRQSS